MTEIELLWLSISAIGLMLAVLGIVESKRDLDALRSTPKNGRHLIAAQQLIRYVLRIIIALAWIVALANRDDPNWAVACLILANIALSLSTASDLYVGVILRRMYAREPDKWRSNNSDH